MKYLSALFTILGVCLAPIGGFTSSWVVQGIGIVDGLSPYFFIGLGAVVVALFLEILATKPSFRMLLLQLILIEVYLWVLPSMFGQGLQIPAGNHDFSFYPNTASIAKIGRLDPNTYFEQSFPGPFIFLATLRLFFPTVSYIQFYLSAPFALNLFVSTVILSFLRQYLPSSWRAYAFLGVAFFELFNFTEMFTTITPFSLGSVLFYAWVFTLLAMCYKGGRVIGTWKLTLISGVFLLALSIVHPVFGVEGASAISALYLYEVLHRRMRASAMLGFVVLALMITGEWGVYYAAADLQAFRVSIFESWGSFASVFFGTPIQALSQPSPAFSLVVHAKLATLLLLGLTALPSFLKGLSSKVLVPRGVLFVLAGLIVPSIWAAGAQGTTYDVYLFSLLLPIIILLDILTLLMLPLKVARAVAIAFLVMGGSLSLPILYGNVAAEGMSTSGILASEFMSSYLTSTSIQNFHSYFGVYLGYYGQNLSTIFPFTGRVSYSNLTIDTANMNLPNPSVLRVALPQFAILGDFARTVATYSIGTPTPVIMETEELASSPYWDISYSSSQIVIFASSSAS